MRENKVIYGLIGYGGMGRWHTEILSNVPEIEIGGTTPSEDYLAVELTNDTPVYMPLEQLRPYFPNILSVHCNWLHTELSGEQKTLRQTIQNRTINEMTVFSQFLQQICGTEPTKEDEILFQKLFTELKEEQTNS